MRKLFSIFISVLMIFVLAIPVSARNNRPPYRIRTSYHIYKGSGTAEFTCTQGKAIYKIQQAAAQRKAKIICHVSGKCNMNSIARGLGNPYASSFEYAIRTIDEYSYIPDGNTITVNYSYILTPHEERVIASRASSAVKGLHLSGSNYQKALKINDYLCTRAWYVDSERSTPYNLLVQRGSTCEGYALTFLLMCQKAGIPAHLVLGNYKGGGHAWNVFASRGRWYCIDVTFNDYSSNHRYIRAGKYMYRHAPWSNARAMLARLPVHPATHDYAVRKKAVFNRKSAARKIRTFRKYSANRKPVSRKSRTSKKQTASRRVTVSRKQAISKRSTASRKQAVSRKTAPKPTTLALEQRAKEKAKEKAQAKEKEKARAKAIADAKAKAERKAKEEAKAKAQAEEKVKEKAKEEREAKEEKLAEARDQICFYVLVVLLCESLFLLICCVYLAIRRKREGNKK